MKPSAGGRQHNNIATLSGTPPMGVTVSVTDTVHDPAQIAKALMALAVDADEPAPLLDAARVLLEGLRAKPSKSRKRRTVPSSFVV
jgi:hypothetical protein